METNITKIAIVEDQDEIRQHLEVMLNAQSDINASAFCSAEDLLESKEKFHLIIMDIGLPGMNGIECLVRIKASQPELKVLMFTVMEHDDKLFLALASGADGYLLKHEQPTKIMQAVEEALHGGAPMSSDIARRVLLSFRPQTNTQFAMLTDRERRVLELLAQGFLYKEIADDLNIALNTVKQHIHHIYHKLHVQNRTEAVLKFLGKD